jgi:hypothetical protein
MTKICIAPNPGAADFLTELATLSPGATIEVNPYPQSCCIVVQVESDVDTIRQFINEAGYKIREYKEE